MLIARPRASFVFCCKACMQEPASAFASADIRPKMASRYLGAWRGCLTPEHHRARRRRRHQSNNAVLLRFMFLRSSSEDIASIFLPSAVDRGIKPAALVVVSCNSIVGTLRFSTAVTSRASVSSSAKVSASHRLGR